MRRFPLFLVLAILVLALAALNFKSVVDSFIRWPAFEPQPIPIPIPYPNPSRPGPWRPDPSPCPGPGLCPSPRRPRQAWGPRSGLLIGDPFLALGREAKAQFVVSGPEYEGIEVACDLPADRHLQNAPGSDGAGLCVFTTIDMVADWCGERVLLGFRDWMRTKPGGGFPDKVTAMITAIAAERRMPEPEYIQVTNGDAKVLEAAVKSRRMIGITYSGRDGVFYRQRVAHMVACVYFDSTTNFAAILDSNYPGKLLWMRCPDLLERWRELGGGWMFALRAPGPPPIPTNSPSFGAPPMYCPNCPPPPPAIVAPAPTPPATAAGSIGDRYEWVRFADGDRDLIALRKNGQQVGAYRISTDKYFTLSTTGFIDDQLPPVQIPAEYWPRQPVRHDKLFGVVDSRLKGPAYQIGGRAASQGEVLGNLQAGLPDTREQLWLVIHGGTDAQRAAVVNDMAKHPALASVRNRVVVKNYAAGEWPLNVGFVGDGTPTIQLLGYESAGGKAPDYGRLTSYPGAEALAEFLVEGIRKADPNYKPELARRATPWDFDVEKAAPVLALLLVVLLLIVVAPRRR